MSLWGNTDQAADKPKYLNDADKDLTYGISIGEAQALENIAKGISSPGWVRTVTYTDAQGNVRNKSETLVAMSSITGDADALPSLPVITINTQPTSATAVAGETETFAVTASITSGAALSYQWQKSNDAGANWANISGATSASYTTGVLTVEDDNGDQYRVVVSGTLGAVSVTSNVVTLTVTAV